MSAFPPHRSIPSIPVTQDVALKYLQTYLEATKSSPHLLPNARLESSGPTVGTSSSSVTMHNLQRVEAGLRGEWLAPSLDLEENNVKVAKGMDDGTNTGEGGEGDHMQVDGWQDLHEYQREQSIEEGDIVPSQTAVAQDGEGETLEINEQQLPQLKKAKGNHGDVIATEERPKKAKDKEVRKQEKKARHKEQKKKEAQRKNTDK